MMIASMLRFGCDDLAPGLLLLQLLLSSIACGRRIDRPVPLLAVIIDKRLGVHI